MYKSANQASQTTCWQARSQVAGQTRGVLTEVSCLFLIAALLAMLATMATPVPVAYAATTRTINVDNVDDNNPTGGCTLREAIDLANAGTGAGLAPNGCTVTESGSGTPIIYDINLPMSYTYTLVGAAGNDDNSSGDLDIAASLNINGAGAGSTIIDGNNTDRVFHIVGVVITVDISGVTIRNGNIGSGNDGGGILNQLGGTVNITNSTLSGNTANNNGGGIYNAIGTMNITNSTLSGNTATVGDGGGIYNQAAATVNITNSTLSGNTANINGGGGIYNSGSTVNITDSTLSNNTANTAAGGGGGISNRNNGTVNITNSTLSDNTAASLGDGGGILNGNSSVVNITNSTLSGNTAALGGGGICSDGISTTDITNSTIFSNTAGYGGGISSGNGIVTIINSTLSSNRADWNGGGITHSSGTTTLDNVTITNNTADNDGNGTGDGGGVYRNSGTVNLRNTIIAANTDKGGATVHPDVSGNFNSNGYNLIGDGTGSTGLVNGVNNNQVGTSGSPIDPKLDSLANSGGSTQTHALQAGSPAIDAGSCTDSSSNPVITDQRGVSRPQGAICDVGAYEVGAPNLSKMVTPTTDVTHWSVVTYTVVLSNSDLISATGILLTDTLPSEVDFASWVEQPAGANQANDQITWSGTVTASAAITFTFVVTHTGDYGDVVTNTAEYSYTIGGGSDDATFTVESTPIYLPIILKGASP